MLCGECHPPLCSRSESLRAVTGSECLRSVTGSECLHSVTGSECLRSVTDRESLRSVTVSECLRSVTDRRGDDLSPLVMVTLRAAIHIAALHISAHTSQHTGCSDARLSTSHLSQHFTSLTAHPCPCAPVCRSSRHGSDRAAPPKPLPSLSAGLFLWLHGQGRVTVQQGGCQLSQPPRLALVDTLPVRGACTLDAAHAFICMGMHECMLVQCEHDGMWTHLHVGECMQDERKNSGL